MIDIETELAAIRELYTEMDVALTWPDDILLVPDERISDWSIVQQLYHVSAVNRTVGFSLTKLVKDSEDQDADRRANLTGVSILASGYIPRGRAKSPARLHPSKELTREDTTTALNSSRMLLDELDVFVALLSSRNGRIEHPYLGYLKPSQWVRFMHVHTEHHMKIVRDIERSGNRV